MPITGFGSFLTFLAARFASSFREQEQVTEYLVMAWDYTRDLDPGNRVIDERLPAQPHVHGAVNSARKMSSPRAGQFTLPLSDPRPLQLFATSLAGIIS